MPMTAACREAAPRLGAWSAWACTALSLAYVLAQLAEWLGRLGSAGGPHSRSTSFGLALLLTPSLLLGPAFVAPRLARGDTAGIELLLFEPFDSFLYAVDMLGYSLMSLATLCAAAVFRGGGRQRWIRRALLANGGLLPFLALQMYWPALIWGGSLWAVTFPLASVLLALHFRAEAGRAMEGSR